MDYWQVPKVFKMERVKYNLKIKKYQKVKVLIIQPNKKNIIITGWVIYCVNSLDSNQASGII